MAENLSPGDGNPQRVTNAINKNADTLASVATAAVTSIAALTPAADKVPYYTSGSAAALADLTAAGRALMGDADAAEQRATLGLGAMATAAAASQAEMEAASSTAVGVTPGRTHHHPGVAKAVGLVAVSGGTPTLTNIYGCASVSDGGVGVYTITWATAFSSGDYAVFVTPFATATGNVFSAEVSARTTTTATIKIYRATGSLNTDLTALDNSFQVVAFGDQ